MRSAEDYPLGEGELRWTCTEWLADNLDGDFLLLDTQPNIHDYIIEHIPGAVYFNPALLRVPCNGIPGYYIDEDAVEANFERAGIESDRDVIVYTGTGACKGWGDGLEQTFVAYALLRFGCSRVWLLDGGLDTWKHEGRPLEQTYPEIERSDFDVEVRKNFFLSYQQFKKVKDDENVIVLDARPPNWYEGESPWMKPGHIPGSVNFPWKNLMHPENARLLKGDDEIRSLVEQAGITEDHHIICSCGTGREATNEFLLFKYYLGHPCVSLYEGAYTEWLAMGEDSVTGPDPG